MERRRREAVAADRADQVDAQEAGRVAEHAGGSEVERETAHGPKAVNRSGVEEPRRSEGNGRAERDAVEVAARDANSVCAPTDNLRRGANRGAVQLGSAAETDGSVDERGVGGLGECHGSDGHGSNEFECVFHFLIGLVDC